MLEVVKGAIALISEELREEVRGGGVDMLGKAYWLKRLPRGMCSFDSDPFSREREFDNEEWEDAACTEMESFESDKESEVNGATVGAGVGVGVGAGTKGGEKGKGGEVLRSREVGRVAVSEKGSMVSEFCKKE